MRAKPFRKKTLLHSYKLFSCFQYQPFGLICIQLILIHKLKNKRSVVFPKIFPKDKKPMASFFFRRKVSCLFIES